VRIGLASLVLLLATTGCGGGESRELGNTYNGSLLRSCLKAAGARVLEGDPAYIAGDASRGAFHVGVDESYATVAIAVSEEAAAETERLAQVEFESYGGTGDGAHHRGNVAYWRLDESDAPVRALEKCL
jgi:hypothetical protein